MSSSVRLWILRIAAWSAGIAPLLWLIYAAFTAHLGANPVEYLEHQTGQRALQLLLATLAMTPLRRITGWTEWIRVRRVLGLWAYAYVCLHFSTYLVFDLELSPAQLGADLIKRTYITLGFAAWLLLLPLALTSTKGWQRRLKRRWQALHKLIYPAALLGAIHFIWLVKADEREPLIYLCILLVLLALRLPVDTIRRAILRPRSSTPDSHADPRDPTIQPRA
ncbi:MAG: sulfoxide reductase heme-binding subunit YedZ [Nevskia sp.]|nr:sulfoxide reductase heme-binding subunit YedZ [Nevskia sp.]